MHNVGVDTVKQKNKGILGRSISIIRDYGILSFAGRASKRLIKEMFAGSSATWYCARLDRSVLARRSKTPNISVNFNRKDEVLSWIKSKHDNFGWMYVSKELELINSEKHIIATARKKNEIIGYMKIARKKVYISDYDSVIKLPEDTVVIYDTFILPQHRGQGFATFMIIAVIDALRDKQYNSIWCHIPDWNKASIKAYTKAGFNKVAHVKFIRFLGFKFFSKNVIQMLNSKT